MKKSLLTISLLLSLITFGQNKITSKTNISYNESGVKQYVDSTTFMYSSWQGSINEYKPKLRFDEGFFSFILDQLLVNCNSENHYLGTPSPMSLDYTTINTLTNGMVAEANTASSTRTLYEYNSLGKIKTQVTQYNASGTWFTQDSALYTYNSFGSHLSSNRYYFNSGIPDLVQSDTSWYTTGTDNLIKYRAYYQGIGSLELETETLVTYTGNNIQNVDLYYNNGSGGLDWTYRINYTYSGSVCTGFLAYEVFSNVPSPTTFATGVFSYTSSNQPFEYILSFSGVPESKIQYAYYPDGFVKKENFFYLNSSNALYLAEENSFYYQNTTGIQKVIDATISIYPNPIKDIIVISSSGTIESIQILNLSGQVILEQTTNKIDIQHLPAGMYIIQGTTDNGSFSKKIVKE